MSGASDVLPSGFMLQEYRIDSVLGAGGFGITYKAWDIHLNTWVAIKEYFPTEWCYRGRSGVSVLSNTHSARAGEDEQVFDYEWGLDRFLDEARVLARVQSPYVVRVKRYFRANGSAYIVMDYEEGEPLNRRLKRVKILDESHLLTLLREILLALQSVHDQGFLHRDIKPSNLYVRARDDCVMLIDFGAARQAIGQISRSITGLVTPGYSPPEQYAIRSDRYGNWTDIYALGAVLYRCITGKPPMEAAERMLEDRMVPASEAGAGRYSPALLAAIDRALAVRPEERYQSAREMQWDLGLAEDAGWPPESADPTTRPLPDNDRQAFTRVSPPPLSPPVRRRRGSWPWWLGMPLVLAMVVTLWMLASSQAPTPARDGADGVVENPAVENPAEISDTSPLPADPVAVVDTPGAARGFPGPGATFLESFINMPMVWVPGGCFSMGSPLEETGRQSHEAPHQRCVNGFWMARHEVSNAQFRQFQKSHDSGVYQRQSLNADEQPVVEVSWHDAVAFARWLSEQTGRRYRLPSEVEWEYAARAGTTTARYWGDAADRACDYANIHDLESRRVNTEFADFSWNDFHDCDDGAAVTRAVGQYRPNAWGLYDMLGNVWEWTCSAYQENLINVEDGCPAEGEFRVLRGSSWVGVPDSTRSAQRLRYDATQTLDAIGFRLLREDLGNL